MVADRVVVETRRAGSRRGLALDVSDGKGSYEIAPLALDDAPARGTRVILHHQRGLRRLPRALADRAAHQASIRAPSRCRSTSSRSPAPSRARVDRRRGALGQAEVATITPEEYTEFYRGLGGQFDEPALTIHWRAEGRHEYTVLAFVPGSQAVRPVRSRSARARAQALRPPRADHRRTPTCCRAGCASCGSSSTPPTCRSTSRAR